MAGLKFEPRLRTQKPVSFPNSIPLILFHPCLGYLHFTFCYMQLLLCTLRKELVWLGSRAQQPHSSVTFISVGFRL